MINLNIHHTKTDKPLEIDCTLSGGSSGKELRGN